MIAKLPTSLWNPAPVRGMTRRALLQLFGFLTSGISVSLPFGSEAHAGPSSGISMARLALPGLPNPRPGALTDLLRDVAENCEAEVALTVPEIAPDAPELFHHPFVVWSGDQAFEPLSEIAVAQLRLYLREGGFLFVEDARGLEDSGFDASVRRDLSRVLPKADLVPIGRDHAIYRSFFYLRGAAGRILVQPYLEGLWLGDITPVLYSRNDLLGALLRSPSGGYALEVVPGGHSQRIACRQLGINLVLFALTGNYKRDAVHVKTLLERMRRQGGYAR